MTKLRAWLVLFAALCSQLAGGCDPAPDTPPEEPRPLPFRPDGGGVLLEYVHFDTELQAAFNLPAGETTIGRVIAYFMNRHTPEHNALPVSGVCTDLVATRSWPLYIGTPREDLDVGLLTITGKRTAGDDVTIPIPRRPMGTDDLGRPHDIYYQISSPDAAGLLRPNSAYTVSFGGAGIIPPATFPGSLFLAEHFTVSAPGLEDDGPLTSGTDFAVRWAPATSSNLPRDAEVIGIAWLADTTGSPTHLCPVPHELGQLTIPGSAISAYRSIAQARGTDPSKAILVRGALVIQLETLPNGDPDNVRRLDMVTQYSWAQLVDVQ